MSKLDNMLADLGVAATKGDKAAFIEVAIAILKRDELMLFAMKQIAKADDLGPSSHLVDTAQLVIKTIGESDD